MEALLMLLSRIDTGVDHTDAPAKKNPAPLSPLNCAPFPKALASSHPRLWPLPVMLYRSFSSPSLSFLEVFFRPRISRCAQTLTLLLPPSIRPAPRSEERGVEWMEAAARAIIIPLFWHFLHCLTYWLNNVDCVQLFFWFLLREPSRKRKFVFYSFLPI